MRISGLILLALCSTTAAARAQAPGSVLGPDLVRAKKLFESKGLCFTCHGQRGEGLLGPTTQLVGRSLTHTKPVVSDIAALIRAGIPATASQSGQVMPPRGGSRLTDDEVDLIAAYVKELNAKKQ